MDKLFGIADGARNDGPMVQDGLELDGIIQLATDADLVVQRWKNEPQESANHANLVSAILKQISDAAVRLVKAHKCAS